MSELLAATDSSRVTIRLSELEFAVAAEALAAGVDSLRGPPPADVRGDPVARRVIDDRETVVADTVADEQLAPDDPRRRYRIKAEIVTPVVRDDACVGTLSVHELRRERAWTEAEVAAVRAAAARATELIHGG